MAGEKILHIGYDSVLIELRNAVLLRGHYQVVSVKGNAAAQQIAASMNPDLIIIGSGGRYEERLEMAEWLLQNVPRPRILAMCLSDEEAFPDGVFQFTGNTPRDWLLAVESALAMGSKSKSKTHNRSSG